MKSTNGFQNFPSLDYHHISYVYPISLHEKYRPSHEYSDNLILPSSIFTSIKYLHLPLPPVFSIRNTKANSPPILCGALSFTAPENTVYCPSWILKKMNKKQRYATYQAIIEIIHPKKHKSFVYPSVKRIEVFTNELIDINLCRKGISRYTIINKGEWLNISVNDNVYKIYISGLFPKNQCVIKTKTFELVFTERIPQVCSYEDSTPNINPLIESIHIPIYDNKRSKINKIKEESPNNYSLYSHQTQRIPPIRYDSTMYLDSDILPWEKDEIVRIDSNNIEINSTDPYEFKPRRQSDIAKITFPQIKFSDGRPLTTVQDGISYKPINSSPNSKNLGFKNKNNSVSY